jgi:transposase
MVNFEYQVEKGVVEMKGWHMYSKIQRMKEQGFSIRQISRMLRVSRNTIKKYWDMSSDDYAVALTAVNKLSSLMAYEHAVLHWLESYPCMTAAQVRDWLEERFSLDAAERTVRRFVAQLREEHGITRQMEPLREYEPVDELPMGYQLQLDFGIKSVRSAYSSRYIKLYVAAFSLSCSRYKWGLFKDKPFTSEDLVHALHSCFEYYGGMPKQLVYDQDTIMVVSENNGDIIHTHAFAAFLEETKLDVLVCRKNDPESKGKIEAVVRFIKGNFMENRLFMDLDIWNRSFEDWLVRTGNGRVHDTTKRKPCEMFLEEQVHLRPLLGIAPEPPANDTERTVRKDNTILYRSNRYALPLGTYGKQKKVVIEPDEQKLNIFTVTGDKIITYPICLEKGRLIKADAYRRETDKKITDRLDKTVLLLGEEFREYLTALCTKKPRYVKEQLGLVVKTCEAYGREATLTAVKYCTENELFSANDLAGATAALCEPMPVTPKPVRLPVDDERYHISVQKRSLSVYSVAATAREARK